MRLLTGLDPPNHGLLQHLYVLSGTPTGGSCLLTPIAPCEAVFPAPKAAGVAVSSSVQTEMDAALGVLPLCDHDPLHEDCGFDAAVAKLLALEAPGQPLLRCSGISAAAPPSSLLAVPGAVPSAVDGKGYRPGQAPAAGNKRRVSFAEPGVMGGVTGSLLGPKPKRHTSNPRLSFYGN